MKKERFKSPDYNWIYNQYMKLIQIKKYKTGHGNMYQKAVEEFLLFMERNNVSELHFDRDQLTAYYSYLIQRPSRRKGTLSDNTVNHHLFAIKLLFELILDSGKADSVPMLPKYLRGNYTQREVLSVDEIKHLYSLTENKLEAALLSAAYGCGLRRSEIEALNLLDVDLRAAVLIVRSGKNSKRREVPLSNKVITDFRAYLTEERFENLKHHQEAFFINGHGNRMRGNSHYSNLKSIIGRSTAPGFEDKKITLHSLRHSIATHLAEKGADIYFIKSFLGHTHIDTSHLYAIRRKRQTNLFH